MTTLKLYDSTLGQITEQEKYDDMYALKVDFDYDIDENEGYDPVFFKASDHDRTFIEKWSEHSLSRFSETFKKALRDGSGLTSIDFALEEIDFHLIRRSVDEFDVRLTIKHFVTVDTICSFHGLICSANDLCIVSDELEKLASKQRDQDK